MEDYGGGGGGRRTLRYEFSRETNGSTAGLTLGGILSIKETPSYRIHNRTLLDLIRDDPTCGNDSKKMWKMFREKLWLRLAGSVCTTAGGILASHVHIITDNNRTTTENGTNRVNSPSVSNSGSVTDRQTANGTDRSNSPPVTNSNTSSVLDTLTENVRNELPVEEQELERTTAEENRGGGDGGPATVKMSLMSLLEVDGSACFDDDEDEKAEEVAEGGGGGGGDRYNNCCVCMVRHKGAAFIPCGHTFCRVCSRELFVKRANCPLCNHFILEILDIF